MLFKQQSPKNAEIAEPKPKKEGLPPHQAPPQKISGKFHNKSIESGPSSTL
jgi:hypothetical protein